MTLIAAVSSVAKLTVVYLPVLKFNIIIVITFLSLSVVYK